MLQLRDHARLGLIRGRDTVDETFRKLGYVERLEHIFVVDVLEEDHLDSSSAGIVATQVSKDIPLGSTHPQDRPLQACYSFSTMHLRAQRAIRVIWWSSYQSQRFC